MKKIKRDWVELWWKMAGGVKSEFDRILMTDVFDFWTIYDLWLDRLKEENARAKKQ